MRWLRLFQWPKASDCVDVATFGAKGDGVTDDTRALQRAIDTVKDGCGRSLSLKPGTYRTTSTLLIKGRITVVGAGPNSIIHAAANHDVFLISEGATGSMLTRFQIRGSSVAPAPKKPGWYAIMTAAGSPPTDVTVSNLLISGRDALTGCNNGIKLNAGSDRWVICNNQFERLTGTADGSGYGILLESHHNVIKDNIFRGRRDTHGRHAVYLSSGASFNIVADNMTDMFNEEGITIYSKREHPPCRNNSIVNNLINGGGRLTVDSGGIGVYGNAINNHIEGNTVRDYDGYGIVVSDASQGGICIGTEVLGNAVRNAGTIGIVIVGAKQTNVQSNTVFRASRSEPGQHSGIDVRSAGNIRVQLCEDTTILSNTSLGLVQKYAFVINKSEPKPQGTIVAGNTFIAGAGQSAYELNGAPCIFLDNVVT